MWQKVLDFIFGPAPAPKDPVRYYVIGVANDPGAIERFDHFIFSSPDVVEVYDE